MDRTTQDEFETRTGAASNRFDGIKRDYSMADVERLSGSVPIEYTLARNGANKLWIFSTPRIMCIRLAP